MQNRLFVSLKNWISKDTAALQRFQSAHQELTASCTPAEPDARFAESRATARTFLDSALQCAHSGNLLQAWSLLQHAERALVPTLSDSAMRTRLCALQRESAEKLEGWRCAAAKDITGLQVQAGTGGATHATSPTEASDLARSRLQEMMRLLNEAAQNTYLKQHMVRVQVWTLVLMWTAFVVLAWLCPTAHRGCILSVPVCVPPENYLRGLQIGVFASLLSMTFNFIQPARNQKVPAVSADLVVMLMRPFVGGASAVAVVLLLNSKVFMDGLTGDGALTVCTFLAGFSERWFKDSIEGFVLQKRQVA